LRKFSTGDNAGVVDVGLYNAAGLIKTLLGKFAELNRGCMIEIESIAPEVLHHHSGRTKLAAGGSGETSFKDNTVVSEAELRRAISRERQAAVMVRLDWNFLWIWLGFLLSAEQWRTPCYTLSSTSAGT
jgi:hypothetical protein